MNNRKKTLGISAHRIFKSGVSQFNLAFLRSRSLRNSVIFENIGFRLFTIRFRLPAFVQKAENLHLSLSRK